ncbi:hypothetical protein BD413DRAFT_231241 [Trametes elegans]|nr:hypothetical protein BD413DRAFT_231241 [Trametes elegans]
MHPSRLTALIPLCAVAVGSYALLTVARDTDMGPGCPGARAVSASAVAVGRKTVELTTFACDTQTVPNAAVSAHADADEHAPSPSVVPSATSVAPALSTPTLNVCSDSCTNGCGESGDLPPTAEDCATIVDAITILNGSISPSFDVAPEHMQTLAFGTCRFSFQNLSPLFMTECWSSFAQFGSSAASACFPPVQPVNSEGVCTSQGSSRVWRVVVTHS